MPKPRKAGLVDPYAAIKAAQLAVKSRGEVAPVSGTQSGADELQRLGAQVRQGAVPTKQVIECYECGYKFQLHGRAATTNCSKCRVVLDLTDHTIDRKRTGTTKTVGTIRIAADAVVQSGELIGNDIILEGTVEAGTVRAMRRLELRPGARFSEQNVHALDLLIAPGATIAFLEPAKFRDVEIVGLLHANLHATGHVVIRAGGSFNGTLQSPRLIVEDGAGLGAVVRIGHCV